MDNTEFQCEHSCMHVCWTCSQTIEHQRSHAEAAGFKINEVIADHGVSGITAKLADRPGGRRLLDKVRSGDHVFIRWVDRLGRTMTTRPPLMAEGIIVKTVINTMVFDGSTTDPSQKAVRDAMIAFMAATARAQAEPPRQRRTLVSPMRSSSSSAAARGEISGQEAFVHPRAVRHRAHNVGPTSGCQCRCRSRRPQSADDLTDRTRPGRWSGSSW
jgi:DNA invertase Pin-like site-specific DNA recombinase